MPPFLIEETRVWRESGSRRWRVRPPNLWRDSSRGYARNGRAKCVGERAQIDTGGELSIHGERSDAVCVGVRFIAPWGSGGVPAIEFATSIQIEDEPIYA